MLLALFTVNPASGVPIYLQLMDRLRHAVESCVLTPGEQLPAIRILAQHLVVSPNTVVKAYNQLEREGVIEIRHGLGAFVADSERRPNRNKEARHAMTLVKSLVATLRKRGFTSGQIRRFVEAELEHEAKEVENGH